MISRLTDIQLSNTFAQLPRSFCSHVTPTPLRNPTLLAFNRRTAADLGWADPIAQDPGFLDWISGARQLPGSQPLAMVYAGHQFGVYVPQLGDGRAILLGEVPGADGERMDIQLKGAGVTPYSRNGDGRAVTRSVVREYLAGIAMRGLGIPSTQALAVVGSDEPVQRETLERAAMLVRIARSHIRFGHFEYFFYQGRKEELQALVDYTVQRHYAHLQGRTDMVAEFFREISLRTAQLVAHWMAVGFQHGVMNTDNMSIVGDTLDYGPYGFMDAFDPSWICNHSDHSGRYAFMQQPGVGLWNLGRLARALTPLAAEEPLVAGLEAYQSEVAAAHLASMRRKLGLETADAEDGELVSSLFALLHANRVDYTNFFRALCEYRPGQPCAAVRDRFADLAGIDNWLIQYGQRLASETASPQARDQYMRSANPRYILRNHIAQQVIEQVEAGDTGLFDQFAAVLEDPCAEWPEHAEWAQDAPEWSRHLEISCSS